MLLSIFYKIVCLRFIAYNNLKGHFPYLNGRKKCSWHVNYSNSMINIKAMKANPSTL